MNVIKLYINFRLRFYQMFKLNSKFKLTRTQIFAYQRIKFRINIVYLEILIKSQTIINKFWNFQISGKLNYKIKRFKITINIKIRIINIHIPAQILYTYRFIINISLRTIPTIFNTTNTTTPIPIHCITIITSQSIRNKRTPTIPTHILTNTPHLLKPNITLTRRRQLPIKKLK